MASRMRESARPWLLNGEADADAQSRFRRCIVNGFLLGAASWALIALAVRWLL